MPNQPRHTVALRVATKLATRLRELDDRSQIIAVREWRATVDALTTAIKRARRLRAERARTAKNEGRETRLDLPGVSGRILDLVWDYIVEGAAAGAEREITADDAPVLGEAYRLTERAVFDTVRAARDQARGDGVRHRALRRSAVAYAPYVAAAIGYGAMRPLLRIDVVEHVGKEMPALEIAVLALAELGHNNAAIARGLEVDSAIVRRYQRDARSARCH